MLVSRNNLQEAGVFGVCGGGGERSETSRLMAFRIKASLADDRKECLG